MTISEIISLFGPHHVLAKRLGVSRVAVSKMAGSGQINARHWPAILDEARSRGISLSADDLLAAQTQTRAAAE